MKRIFTVCIMILFVTSLCWPQLIQKYAFDEIPKAILPGANTVVKSEQELFCIKSPSEGYSLIKKAITLVNSSASENRNIRLEYD